MLLHSIDEDKNSVVTISGEKVKESVRKLDEELNGLVKVEKAEDWAREHGYTVKLIKGYSYGLSSIFQKDGYKM